MGFSINYKFASLVDAASKYNPSFTSKYLNALLNHSPITPSNLLLFNEIKNHIYRDVPKRNYEIKNTIKKIFEDHWDGYVDKFSKFMTIPDYVFENVERIKPERYNR